MIKKSDYYNYFKVILTILVVIGHAARIFSGHGALAIEKNNIINLINNVIYGFHMPAFMLMSGCVYFYCINDKKKYQDNKIFIIKKFKRLIVPYLFFGIFYVAPICILLGLTKYSFIEYIFKGLFLLKESRHLWFLIYLFIYSVISQLFLKKMSKKIIMITILIDIIISMSSLLYLSDMCYYFIFFKLGLIFNEKYDKIFSKNKNKKYYTFILLLFYILFVYFDKYKIRVITSIFGIAFVGQLINNINFFEKINNNKIYLLLSKYSMGLYLFHPMIIYVYDYYLIGIMNPYILFLSSIVVSISLSLIFTKIIFLNKLNIILGE